MSSKTQIRLAVTSLDHGLFKGNVGVLEDVEVKVLVGFFYAQSVIVKSMYHRTARYRCRTKDERV